MSEAVGAAMAAQLADLGDVEIPGVGRLPEGALSEMQPILRRLHGSLFSLQLGQGVGSLAGEVLTGCEIGLPLIAARSPSASRTSPTGYTLSIIAVPSTAIESSPMGVGTGCSVPDAG